MTTLDRRQLLHGSAAAAALLALGRPLRAQTAPPAGGPGARAAMTRGALAFLGALDETARDGASFDFGDEERRNWHYVPRRRQGLPLREMSPAVRAAARDLMQASLSAAGYEKVVQITELEGVLRELEGSAMRDPERYYVSIFGAPGDQAPWGWRLEGHHLSLNFTLAPGAPVAVTPAFLGANPAEVRSGPRKGLRVLAQEQDLGLALANGVAEPLRPRLIIAARSLGDVVSGPGREDDLKAPAGIPLAELGPGPRGIAQRLIEVYANNLPRELAQAELGKLGEAGLEGVHFAWAGPIDRGQPHYYRLHGPTLLIEYDNTQNDANHIHSVWHDPRGAFGADALRAHYEHGHAHHHG